VSRAGVIPNSLTQDEVGPIARTVTDAALLLDVMAGYDAADPITSFGKGHIPASYAQLLGTDALRGARIGAITNLFGTAERHKEVNQVMEGVIVRMAERGATIVRFDLPEYDALSAAVSTSQFEARTVMDRYFATLGPNAPIKSFAELVAAKTSAVQRTLEAELAVVDGMNSPAYKDRTLNRDKLRLAVAAKMADLNLDAIHSGERRGGVGTAGPHGARAWTIWRWRGKTQTNGPRGSGILEMSIETGRSGAYPASINRAPIDRRRDGRRPSEGGSGDADRKLLAYHVGRAGCWPRSSRG